MEKLLKILVVIPFVAIGLFCFIYSRRLALVLVKSSNILRESFKIKGELGRGIEIFAQVFLIIFAILFVFIGINLIGQAYKS